MTQKNLFFTSNNQDSGKSSKLNFDCGANKKNEISGIPKLLILCFTGSMARRSPVERLNLVVGYTFFFNLYTKNNIPIRVTIGNAIVGNSGTTIGGLDPRVLKHVSALPSSS